MNASNQTAMVTTNSTVKALGNVNFRPLGVCSASVVPLSVDTMLLPPSWWSPLRRHECYPAIRRTRDYAGRSIVLARRDSLVPPTMAERTSATAFPAGTPPLS